MRIVNKISIHCSATKSGTAESFRRYHMQHNHWSDIGYHYVINNGIATGSINGGLELGRPENRTPAAVKGYNKGMIAICLVGSKFEDFTKEQFETLDTLIRELKYRYNIKDSAIKGHRDYSTAANPIYKTCPCFDVKSFLDGTIKDK